MLEYNENVYKKVGATGNIGIVVGIILIVIGLTAGVLAIVFGSKALHSKRYLID